MGNTLEVACLSSAALAYLAYKIVEDKTAIPVEVYGGIAFVPKAVLNTLSDLRRFNIPYADAITRIMKDRISPRASMQWCWRLMVSGRCMFLSFDWLFREISGVDTAYGVQGEFSALYRRSCLCEGRSRRRFPLLPRTTESEEGRDSGKSIPVR